VETAALKLAHHWYQDYALDEALPDHSTLSRVRQRLGPEVVRRFSGEAPERCRAAGRRAGLPWAQRRDAKRSGTMAEADLAAPRHRHRDVRSACDRRKGGTKMPVSEGDRVMQRRRATLRCPLKSA
jgi:hypothetical protein